MNGFLISFFTLLGVFAPALLLAEIPGTAITPRFISPARFPAESPLQPGLRAQQDGKHDIAVAELQPFADRASANSDAQLILAQSYRALSKYPEAKKALDDANWFARFNVITPKERSQEQMYFCIATGAWECAKKSFDELLPLSGNTAEMTWFKAEITTNLGDRKTGMALLREALKKEPQHRWIKITLARMLLEKAQREADQDKISEALQLSTEALRGVDPKAPEFLAFFPVQIRALNESGQLESSEQKINEALVALPGNEALTRMQKQLAIERTALENQGQNS